jgi:hypothetical protein
LHVPDSVKSEKLQFSGMELLYQTSATGTGAYATFLTVILNLHSNCIALMLRPWQDVIIFNIFAEKIVQNIVRY